MHKGSHSALLKHCQQLDTGFYCTVCDILVSWKASVSEQRITLLSCAAEASLHLQKVHEKQAWKTQTEESWVRDFCLWHARPQAVSVLCRQRGPVSSCLCVRRFIWSSLHHGRDHKSHVQIKHGRATVHPSWRTAMGPHFAPKPPA